MEMKLKPKGIVTHTKFEGSSKYFLKIAEINVANCVAHHETLESNEIIAFFGQHVLSIRKSLVHKFIENYTTTEGEEEKNATIPFEEVPSLTVLKISTKLNN